MEYPVRLMLLLKILNYVVAMWVLLCTCHIQVRLNCTICVSLGNKVTTGIFPANEYHRDNHRLWLRHNGWCWLWPIGKPQRCYFLRTHEQYINIQYISIISREWDCEGYYWPSSLWNTNIFSYQVCATSFNSRALTLTWLDFVFILTLSQW